MAILNHLRKIVLLLGELPRIRIILIGCDFRIVNHYRLQMKTTIAEISKPTIT